MARPRSWTDEQKTDALRLYVELGANATARKTGIPRGTISAWAKAAGFQPVAMEKNLQHAVETSRAQAEVRRELLALRFGEVALDFLQWTHEETIDYVGQQGKEVKRKRPVATDIRNLTVAAAVAAEKLELLTNRVTVRTETKVSDVIRNDHERDALVAAIRWELARRDAIGSND